MKDDAPRAFVVDDDAAVRDAVTCLLRISGIAVEAFDSAEDFLRAYRPDQPGCVILDFLMPGMNGLQLQRRLLDEGCRIPVIMLTAHSDVPLAVGAMRSGAVDFMQKPFNGPLLIERVREAIEADAHFRKLEHDFDVLHARFSRLTPRENEILDLMVEGKATKAIATELGSSCHTVQNQRASIFRKLHASSAVDVVRMLLEYRNCRNANLPSPLHRARFTGNRISVDA